jgi:fructokinase
MRILSIGEILWDVFPDREFLGGAPLNVCANLQRCGDTAVLLSGVGDDERGRLALRTMEGLGLTTDFVQVTAKSATGIATVGKDAAQETVFTIPRPAAFDEIEVTPGVAIRLEGFAPDWLYMGTLLQVQPRMEKLVQDLLVRLPGTRCFYDMNLRAGHWNLELVQRLCAIASVLKLNEGEAELLFRLTGGVQGEFTLESFCSDWARRFRIDVICVTLGPDGCFIYADRKASQFEGIRIDVSDTIGAGDAFASAFLHGYHSGWSIEECARFANALGALVASRPGATPAWSLEECHALGSGMAAKNGID